MRPSAEVEAEAAHWLARHDAGNLSPAESATFDTWLNATTAHRIAFLRVRAVWARADQLRVIDQDVLPANVIIREPSDAVGVRGLRRAAWWSVGTGSLAAAAMTVWLIIGGVENYATTIGGFERVPLADGSHVELDTDSEIEVAYGRNRRRVDLERGKAFFQVAKDSVRPFVVEAGTYRITAVGTAFSVRRTDRATEVLVTEGIVRVDRKDGRNSARPLLIRASGRATLEPNDSVVSHVSPSQAEGELSWREGVLVFNDRPLSEVAAEFNRYNRRQLVVLDPEVGDVLIAGRFRPTNLDGLIRLLEPGFGVEAIPQEGDKLLLKFSD